MSNEYALIYQIFSRMIVRLSYIIITIIIIIIIIIINFIKHQ